MDEAALLCNGQTITELEHRPGRVSDEQRPQAAMGKILGRCAMEAMAPIQFLDRFVR